MNLENKDLPRDPLMCNILFENKFISVKTLKISKQSFHKAIFWTGFGSLFKRTSVKFQNTNHEKDQRAKLQIAWNMHNINPCIYCYLQDFPKDSIFMGYIWVLQVHFSRIGFSIIFLVLPKNFSVFQQNQKFLVSPWSRYQQLVQGRCRTLGVYALAQKLQIFRGNATTQVLDVHVASEGNLCHWIAAALKRVIALHL